MNIDALRAELTDDPLTRGYSGMTDQEAADSLNAVDRDRNVQSVSGQEIFEAVDPGDFAALPDGHKTLLYAIVGMGTILVNGTNTKAALLAMFGAGTPTRANLAVLQKQALSRGVEIGFGFVYPGHIQNARL